MFDSRCFDLAEHFLQDEPELREKVSELAQAIQDAVEDWIYMQKTEAEEKS
jgi:hypothetical protein